MPEIIISGIHVIVLIQNYLLGFNYISMLITYFLCKKPPSLSAHFLHMMNKRFPGSSFADASIPFSMASLDTGIL